MQEKEGIWHLLTLKSLGWLLLTFIVLLFAFRNRQSVTFVLDPFANENSTLVFQMPVFVFFILSFGLGYGIASLRGWWQRRALRRALEKEYLSH